MSVTARDTIQGALKLLSILDPSETMAPEDAADGLIMLNDMVDLWALEELNLFTNVTASFTFTGATATLGVGGNFNIPRPITIDDAYYRKSGLDYHLQLPDQAAYDQISQKSLAGDFPSILFYSPDAPLGVATLWPVPTSLQVFIVASAQLSQFADLDTVYQLPQGYRLALKYALVPHLAPFYQKVVPPSVEMHMASVMRILKRSNTNIPTIKLDTHAHGARRLNILTNQYQ